MKYSPYGRRAIKLFHFRFSARGVRTVVVAIVVVVVVVVTLGSIDFRNPLRTFDRWLGRARPTNERTNVPHHTIINHIRVYQMCTLLNLHI